MSDPSDEKRSKKAARQREYRARNREAIAARARENRAQITDSYLRKILKLPGNLAPPELLKLARIHLLIKRELRKKSQ